jgi:hypothetical protein
MASAKNKANPNAKATDRVKPLRWYKLPKAGGQA